MKTSDKGLNVFIFTLILQRNRQLLISHHSFGSIVGKIWFQRKFLKSAHKPKQLLFSFDKPPIACLQQLLIDTFFKAKQKLISSTFRLLLSTFVHFFPYLFLALESSIRMFHFFHLLSTDDGAHY